MTRCPHGHESSTDDFCDECGAPLPSASGTSTLREVPAEPGSGEVCPLCGTPRTGRFCEEDGHDFVLSGSAPAPSATSTPPAAPPARDADLPAPGTWVVTVEADRAYYERIAALDGPDLDRVSFPAYYPRTEIALAGDEVRIGRRRDGDPGPGPAVDLTGPPADPGVSRLHAVLLPDGDGGWRVLDPGSTNGTTVNDALDPIPVQTAVPLADGDRVHVGAYTTLTLRRRAG